MTAGSTAAAEEVLRLPMRNDPNPPRPTSARPPGVPSRRVVGALVACALGTGLFVGASLAPAPPSSLASASTVVNRLLALLAAEGGGRTVSAPAAAVTAAGSAASAAPRARTGHVAQTKTNPPASPPAGSGSTSEGPSGESAKPTGSDKGSGGAERKAIRLPPISHVWLVVLAGQGFAQATSAPAIHPYLTGQLLKDGTLLERYSAIEAYELAGDAALLTGGVGESVSTLSQPCPATSGGAPANASTGSTGGGSASAPAGSTGASGTATAASCPSPSPAGAGQSEADAFLQRVLAPILASSAYGERGLVVVTFGAAAQELSPPALSLTTLGATPPAGALLLSPTLKGGDHSAEAFDSLAPRQSLEAIFAAAR